MSIRREILPSQEISPNKEVESGEVKDPNTSSSSDGDDKGVSPSQEVEGGEVQDPNTGSSLDAEDGDDTSKSSQQMKGKDEVEENNIGSKKNEGDDNSNKGATERKTVTTGEKRPPSDEMEDEEGDEKFIEKKKFKNDKGMFIS